MPRAKNPIDSILDSTVQIARIMRQQMMCDMGETKVNVQQVHALFIIEAHEDITMKEFATALHVTSPSATTFADRLIKLGWIQRKADPKNRKLVRLALSAQGKKILRQMHGMRRKNVSAFFSLLTLREQAILADLHQKLLSRYQERPSTR